MFAMSDTRACSCFGSTCANLRMEAFNECVPPAVASAMIRMAAAAIACVVLRVPNVLLEWPAGGGVGTPVFGTVPSAMIFRAEPPRSGRGEGEDSIRPAATSAFKERLVLRQWWAVSRPGSGGVLSSSLGGDSTTRGELCIIVGINSPV